MLKTGISSLEQEEKEKKYEVELYQKLLELFKKWIDESVAKNVDAISDLVTTGLHHIIDDQTIKFTIKPDHKASRIEMQFLVEQDGFSGDPLDSFGGGATAIISFILRVAVMSRVNCSNLLILDESLSALANVYVPGCADFLRKISEELDINILMVTHNNEFLSKAHTAYEGVKGTSLKLHKV